MCRLRVVTRYERVFRRRLGLAYITGEGFLRARRLRVLLPPPKYRRCNADILRLRPRRRRFGLMTSISSMMFLPLK